jgi:hypothetical protein
VAFSMFASLRNGIFRSRLAHILTWLKISHIFNLPHHCPLKLS